MRKDNEMCETVGETVGELLSVEPCFVQVLSPNDHSILSIHHNILKNDSTSDETPEYVEYVHDTNIGNEPYEIKIDDFGCTKSLDLGNDTYDLTDYPNNDCRLSIGFGVEERPFQYGIEVNSHRNIWRRDGTNLDRLLDDGDIIRVETNETNDEIYIKLEHKVLCTVPVDLDDEYKLFIGMTQQFQRVTLMCNRSFASRDKASEDTLAKEKMRILVTSMNEGSPVYGEGVARGGQHLLMDGMLVRQLKEKDIQVINYSPGASAFVYDAKSGGNYDLPDMLPEKLHRVRRYLSGNVLTIRRLREKEYSVHLTSTLTGFEQMFHGNESSWNKERNKLLSHGDQYLINLPSARGAIQSNDLKIAGTKCKTICHTVAPAMAWKIPEKNSKDTAEDTAQQPTVLLLGGDRSQSIGSIPAAVSTYEDLCILFFDAHFDMRDPNASHHPMVHGSCLFFLLQGQLKKALNEWHEDSSQFDKETRSQIAYALTFLESTKEGAEYLEKLVDNPEEPPKPLRGFEWLQDVKEIDPKRIAFLGMRSKNWEAGSTLGGPLPMLFKNLLQLDGQLYTSEDVRSKGVGTVFAECMEQFRGAFPPEHVERKDEEERARTNDDDARWCPPIMVSWDVDSIDPNSLPCTIAQEADGLSSEECLAFCDAIAETKKMVLMEIIEFNPDLWKGYLDEPIELTLNDLLAGGYANKLRRPKNVNGQRLDLQTSVKLLQDMIVRASQTKNNCPES